MQKVRRRGTGLPGGENFIGEQRGGARFVWLQLPSQLALSDRDPGRHYCASIVCYTTLRGIYSTWKYILRYIY